MPAPAPASRGQLSIWTDIEPAHEADFNRWYDREHMQERVALPGFLSARRFRASTLCPRPYLALYDTADLAVFSSPAYRNAFASQTAWSRQNFQRMRGTQRRVGQLKLDVGQGEAAALALFVLPKPAADLAPLQRRFEQITAQDHVIRATLLCTDVMLSTPLVPSADPVVADAVVMIEATQAQAALGQAIALAAELNLAPGAVYAFQSLWRLGD